LAAKQLAALVAEQIQELAPVEPIVRVAEPREALALAHSGLNRAATSGSGVGAAILASPPSVVPAPVLVGTAVLDCSPLPLHQQIQDFAQVAIAHHYSQIQLVPLFLLPGVHVMEDIPLEVAIAQQQIGNALQIQLQPHLGSDPTLIDLFRLNLLHPNSSKAQEAGRILMSHGSRRAGANQPVEEAAIALNAIPAYWSVEPGLETQMQRLMEQGCREIEIVPYFLFEGGITDAIAQCVSCLNARWPQIHCRLAQPLGATPDLSKHIVSRITVDLRMS
jgi:sirohydrochlorin ferrochelatase